MVCIMVDVRLSLPYFLLVFCIISIQCAVKISKGFDAFLYKPVQANVTCGTPPEQYYNTKEGYVAPRSRILSLCDASNQLLQRPPSFMTDGNMSTSWQSNSNRDKAYITIKLDQPMYGKQIIFYFGDYRRPGQIAIYKSSDFGFSYQPWHYMVSHRHECTSVFGIPESEIYILPDKRVNRVLCQQYDGYPFEYGETVAIELNGDFRGDGSNVHEAAALMRWMNVTNVHIRFSGLYRKFDYIDTRWHHYVVNQISLIARCDCNGHGDGISCPINRISRNRKCVCHDNTCGDHCEMCCPAFNQYPWKKGSSTRWISDETTACERCNCHKHSDSCQYDQGVERAKLSMDINGKYAGGGVCLDCKHNTEGVNCERCQRYYYRPNNMDPTSPNACPSCNCDVAGSRASGQGISYLECVKDAAMAKLHDGRNVGDCFCKVNVIGQKCDTCRDGFYRLELGNVDGCRPCSCYLAGTFQRINICHKDFFGQCPCKAFVKLRDCSSCKDGYYNLQNNNVDGCTGCDCDVGASISRYICDKVTGVCTCRAHIHSKKCKQVDDGFYYPDLHYIFGLRYQYGPPKSSLTTTITIPHDSTYRLLIGYILNTENEVKLTLYLKLSGSEVRLFGPKFPEADIFFCNEQCTESFLKNEDASFYLKAGTYSVEIVSDFDSAKLQLERFIAIPVEFVDATILPEESEREFLTSCSVEGNDLRIGLAEEKICMAGVYSMTMKFEDGALPCNCNPIGSVNSTCNEFAGQCFCKDGVTGRACSRCVPGYFNFSSLGCQECGCKGTDKICHPETGMCNCPANFQGRVCDACQCNGNSVKCERNGKCLECQSNTHGDHCQFCQPKFYGDALVGDCKSCGCHALGAFNQSCDVSNGQCFCKPGVTGKTCSECQSKHNGAYRATAIFSEEEIINEKIRTLYGDNLLLTIFSSENFAFLLYTPVALQNVTIFFSLKNFDVSLYGGVNHYGLSITGCEECKCNEHGALNLQCTETGKCPCKASAEGVKCDACKPGFFGLPIKSCQACDCNITGSITNTNCQNDVDGQCVCKPGVTGRQCGECLKQYADFGSKGCRQCPLCTRKLQGLADDVADQLDKVKSDVEMTSQLSSLQQELKKTKEYLTKADLQSVLFYHRMTQGQKDYTRIHDEKLLPWNTRLNNLISQINAVIMQAQTMGPLAMSSQQRMNIYYSSANMVATRSDRAEKIAMNVFSHLVQLNTLATTVVKDGFFYIQNTPTFNFDSFEQTINTDLELSNTVLGNVTNIRKSVAYQENLASIFLKTLGESEAYFQKKQSEWEGSIATFLLNLQNVHKKGGDVNRLLEQTKGLVDDQKKFLTSTQNETKAIQSLFAMTRTLYQQTHGLYEHAHSNTRSIQGGVEVMFLQYNPQNNIVRVNVLRAYQLAPRDFNSMKADPYFRLSIIPKWYQQGPLESAAKYSTLDPKWDWPVGGTYTFFVTTNQIKITKLIISLYDSDGNNRDDFMGEVVIDLGEVLPLLFKGGLQRTYSLKPQNYYLRWLDTYPGAGENGIQDMHMMLSEQISTVNSMLTQANSSHVLAINTANDLNSKAQLLSDSFNQAKGLASRAVTAVNTYNEIYRLINSSMQSAIEANNSVQAIKNVLKGISVSAFSSQANSELLSAQYFLSQTKKRNVTYAVVNLMIRSETFNSKGIHNPPKSSIVVNGVEHHPNVNGHTVAIVNYQNGNVESVKNFRTDINVNAGFTYAQYLEDIQTGKVVIIVKQGEGSINPQYQNIVMNRVLKLGGQAPFFSGHRGSYILLGYRLNPGEAIPWIAQVAKLEGGGASRLNRLVQLDATLRKLLSIANTTFNAALPQWSEINRKFPLLKASVIELTQQATTATIVAASLESARILINDATSSSEKVLQETQMLLTTVNELTSKYHYLMSASSNITKVLVNGEAKVLTAENKLQRQSGNILKSIKLQEKFSTVNNRIAGKQTMMDTKLDQLKDIAASLPFTVDFQAESSAMYSINGMSGSTFIQKMFVVVSFDVKPSSLNGILWYLLSHTATSVGSFGLYLQNGYVFATFNLGGGNVLGRSKVKLKLDGWYRIQASLVGKKVYLVVQDNIGFSSLTTIESPYNSDNRYINLNGFSRWFLNGFPNGIMSTIRHGSFSGVYDNVYLYGVRYNVWKTVDSEGDRLYAPYRTKVASAPNGTVVSLFGNGHIKQKVDGFSVDGLYSEVELEFRTLMDNVVIFGVTGQTGSFIYGLYLFGGRLMFQFATSLGNNIAIVTLKTIYNNGDWYRVAVSRNGVNATLSVVPSGLSLSDKQAEIKSEYIGVTNLPKGIVLMLGSPFANSPIPPPVRGKFAGDMRNLKLSNSATNTLMERKFDSKLTIGSIGTSLNGIIQGNIVQGIRFYGYMRWMNAGSYAVVLTYLTIPINSIFMSFKTKQLSGLLVYKQGSNTQPHLYIGVLSGNLLVIVGKNSGGSSQLGTPFITPNLTLSDGQWHNASFAYTNSGYQLYVDKRMVYTGWLGNSPQTKIGTGALFIGGVSMATSMPDFVPLRNSLQVDFDRVLVNLIEQNFFSGTTSGVSYAGITPGKGSAKANPACASSFPALLYAPDPLQVRFGKAPWVGVQSYIGFQLPQSVMQKYFKSSFVLTMSFRAMIGDGIMFYIADSETNPTQYVSLELVNGRLRYEFFNGKGKVTIESSNTTNYADDAKWYKVYLLRIYQFGAILIPETMEYKNSRHEQQTVPLSLNTPLYIGGIPSHVVAPSFLKRKYGFNGCLRKFEISSGFDTHALDFTKPDIGGTQTGTASCYSNSEHGAYFNGKTSWLHYAKDFVLKSDFVLSVRFRTYKRTGLLLYLFSSNTPNGVASDSQYGAYALLELNDGKIEFHYKSLMFGNGNTFKWKEPTKDMSYYLCDQKWHTVKVVKSGQSLSIIVDKILSYGGGLVSVGNNNPISGSLYIGGMEGDTKKPASKVKHFDGCLELITLGDVSTAMQASINGNNVVFACPTM